MLRLPGLTPGRGGRRLVLRAAAKVNLALEILGRRADGYHDLVTVLAAVDLADRLIIEDDPAVELRTTAAGVPADERNLALRAVRALAAAAGVERGARITLDKRIPVAAGLGGGSADAAAVLVGLNRLWRLRWPARRLAEVAAGLGADVPFFLGPGPALATGRGDRLQRLAAGSLALVLVNPGFEVSTAEAYAAVTPADYTDGRRGREAARALARRQWSALAACLYNGLEAPVAARHPEIARIKAALLAAGAQGAAMSGSGPTVFGVARSWDQARQLRARLTRGTWRCWAVRTLGGPAVRVRQTRSLGAAGRR